MALCPQQTRKQDKWHTDLCPGKDVGSRLVGPGGLVHPFLPGERKEENKRTLRLAFWSFGHYTCFQRTELKATMSPAEAVLSHRTMDGVRAPRPRCCTDKSGHPSHQLDTPGENRWAGAHLTLRPLSNSGSGQVTAFLRADSSVLMTAPELPMGLSWGGVTAPDPIPSGQ